MSDAEPVLVVENVQKRFGGLVAVNGATFDVAPRSITALIGPNGAGKTTLFNNISGFYRPDSGRIVFRGRRIDHSKPHRIARRGLVRTFQLTKALTHMSVLDNVMLAGADQPGEHLWRVFGQPRAVRWREHEVRTTAMELLRFVKLDEHADAYAGSLSGGQRKLLEFARALMSSPEMVMLDEPTAGVNPTLARQLLDYMLELRHDTGMTFLLIEHDMEIVMNVSDRVIVMSEGRVIAEGTPRAVRQDPAVIDAYLGMHAGAAADDDGGALDR
jgi:ABC-type branched-subunit amino acid transport system ATPase component